MKKPEKLKSVAVTASTHKALMGIKKRTGQTLAKIVEELMKQGGK